jgi:stage II sporulation protein AB (anti-sigma F factor)
MSRANCMALTFPADARNEGFARMVICAFCLELHPTVSELSDVKTAVSEAVTNAIVHAYPDGCGDVTLRARIGADAQEVIVEVEDGGRGIENVAQAMEPFYTTGAQQERSGMGFAVMGSFMDALEVNSTPGKGTLVRMRKRFGQEA